MNISKKLLIPLAMALGIGGLMVAPVSEAGWGYMHHWHWAQTRVKFRGCRKIMVRRYVRIDRWGNRHVERVRNVQWVC